MTSPRTELTITLEEDLPPEGEGQPRRLRLSTTVRAPEGKELTREEIAEATKTLLDQMAHARGAAGPLETPVAGPRPDRSVDELVDSYRPKSLELVDALLWEGELTPTEHEALKAAVSRSPPKPGRREAPTPRPPSPPAVVAGTVAAPSAPAAPAANEPARPASAARFGPARPTDTLVKELSLQNLRDVNVARARRLISFDEWSALKAHFERRPA